MVQLDYSDQSTVPAVKGGLADSGHHDIASRASATTIAFGVGLAINTTGFVLVPTATGFKFEGVAMLKQKAPPNTTGIALYDIGEEISVLRQGRIYVTAEVAVNPTLAVFLRHTVNAALTPGDFRIDADTARADQITNAKWVSTTTTGPLLAILEVNSP